MFRRNRQRQQASHCNATEDESSVCSSFSSTSTSEQQQNFQSMIIYECWPGTKCFLLQLLAIIKDYLDVYRSMLYTCILTLIIWCAFNIFAVFSDYRRYETIITLDRELPDRTDFPGITICGRAIFTPEYLAKLYPKFNESYRKFLNDQYRNVLVNSTEAKEYRYEMFRRYENEALNHLTGYEVIQKASVKLGDLIRWCRFSPINVRSLHGVPSNRRGGNESKVDNFMFKCEQIKKPIPVVYDGRKCFMYFSELNDVLPEWRHYKPPINIDDLFNIHHHKNRPPKTTSQSDNGKLLFTADDLKQMKFVLNPHISMQINMHNHIWDYIGDSKGTTIITVHPPNILPNKRRFRSLQVQRSSYYEVSFTKKITHKLKLPYKTACIDYLNHTIFGRYRTQDMCRNICIKQYSYELDRCANYYMALSSRMFINTDDQPDHHKNQDDDGDEPDYICDHDHQNYTSFLAAENHCEDKCPSECIQSLFQLNGRIDPVMNIYRWPFLDDPDTHTIVVIKISPVPFAKTVHKPRVSNEELIGTIGGHMGVWLGLSIYALIAFHINFIWNIIRFFCKYIWIKMNDYYYEQQFRRQKQVVRTKRP